MQLVVGIPNKASPPYLLRTFEVFKEGLEFGLKDSHLRAKSLNQSSFCS